MTVIDLNQIYKILYNKFILSFKVLDIIGFKHLRQCAKKKGAFGFKAKILPHLFVVRLILELGIQLGLLLFHLVVNGIIFENIRVNSERLLDLELCFFFDAIGAGVCGCDVLFLVLKNALLIVAFVVVVFVVEYARFSERFRFSRQWRRL